MQPANFVWNSLAYISIKCDCSKVMSYRCNVVPMQAGEMIYVDIIINIVDIRPYVGVQAG
jgi:hypothetical protein